jgi:glycosyltransferase involved in cell wall biosynthesis
VSRDVSFGIQTRIDLWKPDMLALLGRAGCVSIEAGIESLTVEGRAALNKRCKLDNDALAALLVEARRHVPFVQANLIGVVADDPALVREWRQRLNQAGVWANDPVPLYPYPSSPSYRALWGQPDDQAWERAHESLSRRLRPLQRPSGGATGAPGRARAVVAASHSCLATWWRAMRDGPPPDDWAWRIARDRRGLEAADLALAPSAAHAAALRAAHDLSTPVQVVRNACGPAPAGGRRDRGVFAAARWWDEGKNGAVLDAAAGLLDAPVIMAGPLEGPDGRTFQARHAVTPGVLPSDEVRRRAGAAAVFVSPSRYEPFGLATLEAAAAGTTLVLADIPAYRELWDGAALFRDPGDAEGFADAARRLLASGSLRRRLGIMARTRARAYAPEVQARQLLAVYARAMARRAAAPAGRAAVARGAA